MATVNKASLRTEFEALKARFEALCAAGKMSPESRALFDALLMLFELLMAVFMEKNTPKNPRNSGLPSSRTGTDESARQRPGAKGKGPRTHAGRSGITRRVAETRNAPVTECRACGRGLAGVGPTGHERRVLVDLVFETRELTVEAEIKTCPRCRTENRGRFPNNLPGPLRYGHGIVAFAVHLMTAQMVSFKRTAQTLKVLTGRMIAEATLLAWLLRLHTALADWEAAAIQRLLASPVLHADETGLRINGKTHWLHDLGAGEFTLKFVHRQRGRAAIDEIGVIPRYGGVLVHDRWASYFIYGNCEHALCGSHLLRDLAFVEDAHDHAWARRLKKLLLDTHRTVGKLDNKALDEPAYKAVRKRYRTILTQARRELPASPKRVGGQRGRIAKSDAENLHEAFVTHETEVLRFARDPDTPFTNNRAERDIRMAKVKQKVSGCFRTPKYAAAYCRISSYLQSMAYQGYNPLTAIEIALNGNAAAMIENTTQKAPDNELQGGE